MLQIIIVTFKRYDTLRIFIFKRYVLLDNKNYEMQFVGLMKSLFMSKLAVIFCGTIVNRFNESTAPICVQI